MKYITIISLLVLFCDSISGQISTDEQPISFDSKKDISIIDKIAVKTVSSIFDKEKIAQEDIEDELNGIPPRFGYPHKVDYNLDNSGTWSTLPDGGRIWNLTLYCPDALSINLLYDKFQIPEYAKFFIYSSDKKQSIGAFTSANNKGDEKNPRGFATGLIYSDEITLEYYLPKETKDTGAISVAYIVQGYRYIDISETLMRSKSFGGSGNCQVNVNCSEGNNWEKEKKAVALILVNGNRYCTGSLINTTVNNNEPLFLTADHCLGGWGNNNIKYDAVDRPTLDHWSFYWHYESSGCSNTKEPAKISTVGATILANNSASDFALLRLTENPTNKSGVTPYYLGWNRTGNAGTGGVGIHHPSGDVKKIATYSITPPNTSDCMGSINENFWKINWIQTTNGYSVTEGGSSGSPLLNNDRHVIGQLYGAGWCANTNCSDPSSDIGNYGKFSTSWTGDNATDSRRRLKDWLDPDNTNVTVLDGICRITNLSGSITQSVTGCAISVNYATISGNANVTITGTNRVEINSLVTSDGARAVFDNGIPVYTQTYTTSDNELLAEPESYFTGELASAGVKEAIEAETNDIPKLYQNHPNPFTGQTTIGYYLPEGIGTAWLRIMNASGMVVKTVNIAASGEGSVVLDANALNPGIYLYSLMLNGSAIDTKRMVVE